jgi:hypothetical protein
MSATPKLLPPETIQVIRSMLNNLPSYKRDRAMAMHLAALLDEHYARIEAQAKLEAEVAELQAKLREAAEARMLRDIMGTDVTHECITDADLREDNDAINARNVKLEAEVERLRAENERLLAAEASRRTAMTDRPPR